MVGFSKKRMISGLVVTLGSLVVANCTEPERSPEPEWSQDWSYQDRTDDFESIRYTSANLKYPEPDEYSRAEYNRNIFPRFACTAKLGDDGYQKSLLRITNILPGGYPKRIANVRIKFGSDKPFDATDFQEIDNGSVRFILPNSDMLADKLVNSGWLTIRFTLERTDYSTQKEQKDLEIELNNESIQQVLKDCDVRSASKNSDSRSSSLQENTDIANPS